MLSFLPNVQKSLHKAEERLVGLLLISVIPKFIIAPLATPYGRVERMMPNVLGQRLHR